MSISGDLAPLGVEIDESVMEANLTAEVLADAVYLAMKEAHNASLELSRTQLSKFYKDMGVPMPGQGGGIPGMGGMGGMGGMPGVAPPAPAAPAPPPMDFDPAGIGPRFAD